MALELRQNLKLTQQLIITPQLQQAIKLLQLSRMELVDTIHEELETNPLLEESQEDAQESDSAGEEKPDAATETPLKEVEIGETVRDDFDWESYLGDYSSGSPAVVEKDRGQDFPSFDQRLTKKTSLEDHLTWQLRLSSMSEDQKEIGSLIIGNLEPSGYLSTALEEIAEMARVDISAVAEVLARMQRFDPIGVASRDLKECLSIQAQALEPPNELVCSIISKHLGFLESKNYQGLVRTVKHEMEEVKAAVAIILNFDPRPGSAYNETEVQYVSPDVYVIKVDGEFVIVLNEDGMPKLRVNAFYKEALSKDSQAGSETKDYIQNKLRSATWLIKSIHQRQRTLYKVSQSIVNFQREFFEHGVAHLKPMVLRDVAEDVGMHESTISRVTTSKYMHTSQGIFELKYFFNSSINSVVGDAVASESVKERIRRIVRDEDSAKPYSDKEIVDRLKGDNISIARRTVAKYREMLNILPSHKRKQANWGK